MIGRGLKMLAQVLFIYISLFIASLVVGYLIDIGIGLYISKKADDYLEELAASRRDGPGNAWPYYATVIEMVPDYHPNRELESYTSGRIAISRKILDEIRLYEKAIELIKEGARQPFCSAPMEYEKGWALCAPNHLPLKKASIILAARSLHALERGQHEAALSDLMAGLTSAVHYMSGVPISLGQMNGIELAYAYLPVIRVALSTGTFDASQLDQLRGALNDFEEGLPPLSEVARKTSNLTVISIGKIPCYAPIEHTVMAAHTLTARITTADTKVDEEPAVPRIRYTTKAFRLRMQCWRYFFSPRLAFLDALSVMRQIEKVIEEKESAFRPQGEEKRKDLTSRVDWPRLTPYYQTNQVFAHLSHNHRIAFDIKFTALAYTHMLQTAASIWQYHSVNGVFPRDLKQLADHGAAWTYEATQDSAVLSTNILEHTGLGRPSIHVLKETPISKYIVEQAARNRAHAAE